MLSSILVAPSDDIGGAPLLGGSPPYTSSGSLEHMNGYSSLVYNVPGMQGYFSENESESDLDIDEVRMDSRRWALRGNRQAWVLCRITRGRLGVNVSIVYLQDRDELVGSLNSGDLELGYLDEYGSWRAWRSGALSILATLKVMKGGSLRCLSS